MGWDSNTGSGGCVAAGALFPGIKAVSGRLPPHATARSQTILRAAGQQGTEAEVLVGVLLGIMHEGLETNEAAVHAVLANVWRPGKPSRDLPDAEEVRRVCSALREIQRQWQALDVGQSLTVVWPPDKGSKRRRRQTARRPARAGTG